MKKQLSLLLMLLVSLSIFAGSKGKIAFEATRYDFGYIEESKGVVAHDFEFTNTGKGALIIIDTRSMCGCTASKYSREPIAPGKKGIINVTFDPKGRPGVFRKEIKVYTSAGKSPVKLIVEGVVVPKKQ